MGLVTLRFYSQARKGVKVVGPSVVVRTVRTAWMNKDVMIDGCNGYIMDMDGYSMIQYGIELGHFIELHFTH